MVEPTPNLDRFRGCLVGLTLGDALGAPYEFDLEPTVDPKNFYKGYFGTAPGDGTDDSALAMKLGLSLLSKNGLDANDYLRRAWVWAESNPPDIGRQTRKAVATWKEGKELEPDEEACGNGSLMACAPLGLFYAGQGRHAAEAGERFSRLTHPSSRSMGAVGLFVQSIARLVVDPRENPPCEAQVRTPECFAPKVESIGLVTWCASLAYQASDRCETAADAYPQLVWVVEQGGDTDTNGAVAGALLGARFGMKAWPGEMVSKLVMKDDFLDLAKLLFERYDAQMV